MSREHLTEDQIQRMIASDPEAPEATTDQLAQARPFTEAFPALVRRDAPERGRTAQSREPKSCRLPAP